jgi:hypothetical protein
MGGERERERERVSHIMRRENPLPYLLYFKKKKKKKKKKKRKKKKKEEEERERRENDSLTFTGRNLMRKLSKFFFHHL